MKQIKTIGRNTKITFNIDKLLQIREELQKKYAARVGVLGSKTNRTQMEVGESHQQYKARVRKMLKDNPAQAENEGQTNAEIGLQHEMGVVSKGIPRRSFLEMPLTLKMPEYYKTFGAQLMRDLEQGNVRPAFVNLGIKGEQVVQLAFASKGFGQWAPNAPATIARKHSSSPLIDTSQLRKSITSDVINK